MIIATLQHESSRTGRAAGADLTPVDCGATLKNENRTCAVPGYLPLAADYLELGQGGTSLMNVPFCGG